MAAVTTASLCPGLGKPRRGHAKLARSTVCHCRLPAPRRTEEVLNRRDALLGVLLSSAAASAAPLLAPAVAFAETTTGNGQPPSHLFLASLSNGVYTSTYYSVNFV
jgi:hypothetical protein